MYPMKKFVIFPIVFVCLFTGIYLLLNIYLNNEDEIDDVVKVEVYAVANGFAYKILLENKVYIQQEYVPSVKGAFHFCTKEDAQKTGELVKNRILLNKRPSITAVDLQKLGVSVSCLKK